MYQLVHLYYTWPSLISSKKVHCDQGVATDLSEPNPALWGTASSRHFNGRGKFLKLKIFFPNFDRWKRTWSSIIWPNIKMKIDFFWIFPSNWSGAMNTFFLVAPSYIHLFVSPFGVSPRRRTIMWALWWPYLYLLTQGIISLAIILYEHYLPVATVISYAYKLT